MDGLEHQSKLGDILESSNNKDTTFEVCSPRADKVISSGDQSCQWLHGPGWLDVIDGNNNDRSFGSQPNGYVC